MAVNRRSILKAAGGIGLAGAVGSCGNAGGSGPAELRMAWWGNEIRTEITGKVIDRFAQGHPDISVTGEPREWDAYWDKLATETAGRNAPDIVQMDLKYLRQYSDLGALLDLHEAGVVTDDFPADTLSPGRTPDGLTGVNAGVNALLVAANPQVFDRLGLDLPDDSSWTWQDWADLSTEISNSGEELIGCSDFTLYDLGIWMWMRQRGKDLYTEDGIGFDADDAAEFFDFALKLEQRGAIPEVGQAAEDIVAPLGDRLFVNGRTAMSVYWSNQVQSLEEAAGHEIALLRFPSMTGKVSDAQLFRNVSMMWSVPARTEDPEAAATFVDFLVNSGQAADILQAERGMPANRSLRRRITPDLGPSDSKAADYLAAIEPDLAPPSPAPPAGLGDISIPQTRHLQDVRFGRVGVAAAAQAYVDELHELLEE